MMTIQTGQNGRFSPFRAGINHPFHTRKHLSEQEYSSPSGTVTPAIAPWLIKPVTTVRLMSESGIFTISRIIHRSDSLIGDYPRVELSTSREYQEITVNNRLKP